MLEPIMKGLIEWIYGLIEDMADYVFGDIIDVMTMDMDYFRKAAPIVNDISEIILALGWALLLGNLVFQLLKSIMSRVGFEGEDPKLLFMRTLEKGIYCYRCIAFPLAYTHNHYRISSSTFCKLGSFGI